MEQTFWWLQERLRFPFLKKAISGRSLLSREHGLENLDFTHGVVEPNPGRFLEGSPVFWVG